MLCIDFGSGYNPSEGFRTCDFVPNPKLDYFYHDGIIEGLNEPVSRFRIRNVIHHLPDIRKTIQDLKRNIRIEIEKLSFLLQIYFSCKYGFSFVNNKMKMFALQKGINMLFC